jgi:hypothetical protein
MENADEAEDCDEESDAQAIMWHAHQKKQRETFNTTK